jgi:2-hydroxychromene-2-carboxylate isomerase
MVRLYLDAGSPYAWLAAERAEEALGVEVAFEPVLLGAIFAARGWGSWSETDAREEGMREVERRAAAYGFPPVRWPEPWPGNTLLAMRVAVAAAERGVAREYLRGALRAGFSAGRDLSLPAEVAAVACAVGIDEDVEALAADPAVKLGLRERTDAAIALGVQGVPSVVVAGQAYWGDDRLEEAAAALRR